MWSRAEDDPATMPEVIYRPDLSILYQFKPRMATTARFEKLGDGPGYTWGYGAGYLEYVIPERDHRRRISEIIVRAHIQPVAPIDVKPEDIQTRVSLYVNGANLGTRLVTREAPGQASIQEWRVQGLVARLGPMRGLPIKLRFEVQPCADWVYGLNISNWPEGYDAKDSTPLEVEVRR
jgi:hypothetical protein